MRQQYDKMNQSIFSSRLRSVFDSGISPHTKCRIFLKTAMLTDNQAKTSAVCEADVESAGHERESKERRYDSRRQFLARS